MIRYIKHTFDLISGVEIYPIISLLIFFTLFILVLLYVFKMPKKKVKEMSNLPLDNE